MSIQGVFFIHTEVDVGLSRHGARMHCAGALQQV